MLFLRQNAMFCDYFMIFLLLNRCWGKVQEKSERCVFCSWEEFVIFGVIERYVRSNSLHIAISQRSKIWQIPAHVT